MSRTKIIAAVAGAALVVPGVAAAAETVTQPAQPGSAEAVAAQVQGVLAVGHTKAEAGEQDSSATANALELGGNPPASQFGGSTNDGEQSGALLDTNDTPLGRVQVTPWHAKAAKSDSCRTASGEAALARVTVVDSKTLDVNVLQSQSAAEHCGLTSKGSGSSDGATVNLGDGALALLLLHSEAASDSTGKNYVLSVNGNEILGNDQAGGNCALELPGLLSLTCLVVGGGEGSVFSTVAGITAGGGALGADVSSVKAQQASAAPAVMDNTVEPAPAPSAEPAAAPGGTLPFTGAELGTLVLAGASLLGSGGGLYAVSRRRRRAA